MAKRPSKAPAETLAAPENADDIIPDPIEDVVDETATVDDEGESTPTRRGRSRKEDDDGDGDSPALPPVKDEGRENIANRWRELRNKKQAEAEDEGEAEEGEDDGEEVDQRAPGTVDRSAEQVAAADKTESDDTPTKRENPSPDDNQGKVELKVDGKTVFVSQEEAIRLAQIAMAGDNRLEETKRLLADARALIKPTPENPPAPSRTQDSPETPPVPSAAENQPPAALDKEKIGSIVDRIQTGDKEEGEAALLELVEIVKAENPKGVQLSDEQIAQAVQRTLKQNNEQSEIDGALDKFARAYPEVVQNKRLAAATMATVQEELIADLKSAGLTDSDIAPAANNMKALAQVHKQLKAGGLRLRTYDQLLAAAGDTMRKDFNLKPTPTPNPASSPQTHRSQQPQTPVNDGARNERITRKRAATQQPQAVGARDVTPAKASKAPRTTKQIVEQMARDRGFRQGQ